MTTLDPTGNRRRQRVGRRHGGVEAGRIRNDRKIGANQPDEIPAGPGVAPGCTATAGWWQQQGVEPGTVCRAHLVLPVPPGTGRRRWARSRRGSAVEPGTGPGTDGSPGSGSEREPPFGEGPAPGAGRPTGRHRRVETERQERLRGVDRFAGRLLGAVSAFCPRSRHRPHGTYEPYDAIAVRTTSSTADTGNTSTPARPIRRDPATTPRAITSGNALRA